MARLRSIIVLLVTVSLLFSNVFFSKAQDNSEWVYNNWNRNKDSVFKLAKEQDRYVFLFFGLQDCSNCRTISEIFANPENRLSDIVEDDYVPWAYKANDIASIQDDTIKKHVNEIVASRGRELRLPFLFVIDPDFSDSYERLLVGSDLSLGPSRITDLQKFLTVDLLTNSALTWYKDKDKVLSLAKEQNKYILKLVGKGTSPICQKVMKQLGEEPLKQKIEDNFILWYSSDMAETHVNYVTAEPIIYPIPFISIIDPDVPDKILDVACGDGAIEMLEEILKSYIVSNEMITSINHVTAQGNVLQISNQIHNEEIQVFTLTGQQITRFRKNDYSIQIDASYFPKGMFIVHSSAGWSKKIVKHF